MPSLQVYKPLYFAMYTISGVYSVISTQKFIVQSAKFKFAAAFYLEEGICFMVCFKLFSSKY